MFVFHETETIIFWLKRWRVWDTTVSNSTVTLIRYSLIYCRMPIILWIILPSPSISEWPVVSFSCYTVLKMNLNVLLVVLLPLFSLFFLRSDENIFFYSCGLKSFEHWAPQMQLICIQKHKGHMPFTITQRCAFFFRHALPN